MPISPDEFNIIKALAELETQMKSVTMELQRMNREAEGTVDRKGYKDRLVIAEHEIESHKEAWKKNAVSMEAMETRINKTIQELFIELKNELRGPSTFIAKYQPFVNIVTWALTLGIGYLLIQILSGELILTRPP